MVSSRVPDFLDDLTVEGIDASSETSYPPLCKNSTILGATLSPSLELIKVGSGRRRREEASVLS